MQLWLARLIRIGWLSRQMQNTEPVILNSSKKKLNHARFVKEILAKKHVWRWVNILVLLVKDIVLYYHCQLAHSLEMHTKHYEMFSKSVITTVRLSLENFQSSRNMSALKTLEELTKLCWNILTFKQNTYRYNRWYSKICSAHVWIMYRILIFFILPALTVLSFCLIANKKTALYTIAKRNWKIKFYLNIWWDTK